MSTEYLEKLSEPLKFSRWASARGRAASSDVADTPRLWSGRRIEQLPISYHRVAVTGVAVSLHAPAAMRVVLRAWRAMREALPSSPTGSRPSPIEPPSSPSRAEWTIAATLVAGHAALGSRHPKIEAAAGNNSGPRSVDFSGDIR
jgi:hypothetical protein